MNRRIHETLSTLCAPGRFGFAALGVILKNELAAVPIAAEEKPVPSAAALERARESVKMLDDLYKTAVVSITSKYTEMQSDTPAAVVAKEIFEAEGPGRHHL